MNKGEWAENVALYAMLASFKFKNFEKGESSVRFRAVGKILPKGGGALKIRWLISHDGDVYATTLNHGSHVPRDPKAAGFTKVSVPPRSTIDKITDAAMKIMAQNKNQKKFAAAVGAAMSPYKTIDATLDSLGLPVNKTNSSHKADLWIVPGNRGATKPKGLNVKCSVCGRTSLLNASSGTNLLFKVKTIVPTAQSTATRSPGALFHFIRTLDAQCAKFTYIGAPDADEWEERRKDGLSTPLDAFFNRTQCRFGMLLGTDPSLMAGALVLMRYIHDWPASLRQNIINIAALAPKELTSIGTKQFRQASWTRHMSTLCRQIMTGATPSNGHKYVDKGDVPYIMSIGYDEVDETATLRALNAPTQHDTIRKFIFDNTELDSPSRGKHDYGYLMLPNQMPVGAAGPKPPGGAAYKAWRFNGGAVPIGTYYMRLNFAWRW